MKKLVCITVLIGLLACSKQTEKQDMDYSNITFQLDTVVVDPGEEIINLRSGLWGSTLNEDNSKLYLFDQQTSTLDIVDLDQLVLEKKVPFEREGPNGTGPFVAWTVLLDNDRILMAGFSEMGLFDMKANKLRGYDISKGKFEGAELQEGDHFYLRSIIAEDGQVIYGFLGQAMRESDIFAKVDFQKNHIKEIDLPGRDMLQDYPLTLKTSEMHAVMPAMKSLNMAGDKLIISNADYANLFIIDRKADSAYQIDYTPNLTAKGKKGGYPKELDSEKKFREVAEQLHAEINFLPPIWDKENKLFYRFSFETTPTENFEGPMFKMAENRLISKLYLSVFDEELNLIGESLTGLKHAPTNAFVKDGKIWFYINMDDELGFVVMSISR